MAIQSLCLEMVLLSIPAILSEDAIAPISLQQFTDLLEELFAADVVVCIGSHWIAKLQACSGTQRDIAYQVLTLLQDRVEVLEVAETLATAFKHLPWTKSIDITIAQENGIDLQVVWQDHGAIAIENLTVLDLSSSGGSSLLSARQFMQSYLQGMPESGTEILDGGLSEIRAWLNPFLPVNSRVGGNGRSLQAELNYHNLVQQTSLFKSDVDSHNLPLFNLGLSLFFIELHVLEIDLPRSSAGVDSQTVNSVIQMSSQAIAKVFLYPSETFQNLVDYFNEEIPSDNSSINVLKGFIPEKPRMANLKLPDLPEQSDFTKSAIDQAQTVTQIAEANNVSGANIADFMPVPVLFYTPVPEVSPIPSPLTNTDQFYMPLPEARPIPLDLTNPVSSPSPVATSIPSSAPAPSPVAYPAPVATPAVPSPPSPMPHSETVLGTALAFPTPSEQTLIPVPAGQTWFVTVEGGDRGLEVRQDEGMGTSSAGAVGGTSGINRIILGDRTFGGGRLDAGCLPLRGLDRGGLEGSDQSPRITSVRLLYPELGWSS
ncbi:MAG: hypothetical protein VKJ24_07180 [Synechococcales bacterium]|nr:hypothetical protein [Synechococcales bacterium]